MTSASTNDVSRPRLSALSSAVLPWQILWRVGIAISLVWVGWIYLMATTDWYLNSEKKVLIWVPVALQVLLTAVCLFVTRGGQGFGAQVKRGLVMTALAAVLTYLGALLITGTLFTDYFSRLRTVQEESLLASGLNAEATLARLDQAQPSNTAEGFAFATFMGTLAIGFFAAAGAAAVFRERRPVLRPGGS